MENTDDTLGVPTTLYPANRFDRELEFQSRGNYDYFEIAPEELRGAYLRDASKMDDLIHEFAGRSVR